MNQALQDVIEHRRTTNVFEPNHTISDEQIEHLVHLATRAPTSFNLQNWRFLAVRTPERKAKLRKLAYDQAGKRGSRNVHRMRTARGLFRLGRSSFALSVCGLPVARACRWMGRSG